MSAPSGRGRRHRGAPGGAGEGQWLHSAALSGRARLRPRSVPSRARCPARRGLREGGREDGGFVWDLTRFALTEEDRKYSV